MCCSATGEGDGSRTRGNQVSRSRTHLPSCQAGCGAPWPGCEALLPGEREQRGAAEVLRWSGSPFRLLLYSNQGERSPCPPASPPTRQDCCFSPTERTSLQEYHK
ncbi:hypothetical protein KUCAC02_001112 [Chaenocephalus aceratus]|uniref:Uncharacterized protein n=1 Tax=Chaenocephalus aceratus TaxID=36190 RepID=A0ACB9XX82_CHAAC|nr:hypothetical protein KUCAC02_001112 [Chaenocephalus aceratus]